MVPLNLDMTTARATAGLAGAVSLHPPRSPWACSRAILATKPAPRWAQLRG